VRVDLQSACSKSVQWAVYSAAYRKIGEWKVVVSGGLKKTVEWNLTDAKGKKMAAGIYYLVITPEGQKSVFMPLVVLP
jgi:hypothetical protein